MKTLIKATIQLYFVAFISLGTNIVLGETLQQYAAKCDAAMGGVTVPDFNCDDPKKSIEVPISKNDPHATYPNGDCDEPNRLNKVCDHGSRFQVISNKPSATIVAHCRKQGLKDGRFGDVAVIQTNPSTGATCFYQALGNLDGNVKAPSHGEGAWPWFSPQTTASYRCVRCHDNGAIIRSPYLAQLKTGTNALPGATDTGFNSKQRYGFVGDDFKDWKVYEVVVDNNRCIGCHRLGISNLASRVNGTALDFALRATGQALTNQMDPMSPVIEQRELHKNPYSITSPIWMPPFHICSDLDNHICFDKDNAAAARQIHDCALRFDVNNLPNSADCRITEYTAGTRVKLTITKVRCIDPCRNEGLEGIFESAPDFYALVDINGVVTQTAREENDAEIIFPPKFGHPWTIFADIPMAQSSFPVSIQIWDKDDSSPDDLGDASPIAGKNNLDLTVDRVTGKWTGDVTWPQTCAQGGNPGGNPAVEVCFIVEVEGS